MPTRQKLPRDRKSHINRGVSVFYLVVTHYTNRRGWGVTVCVEYRGRNVRSSPAWCPNVRRSNQGAVLHCGSPSLVSDGHTPVKTLHFLISRMRYVIAGEQGNGVGRDESVSGPYSEVTSLSCSFSLSVNIPCRFLRFILICRTVEVWCSSGQRRYFWWRRTAKPCTRPCVWRPWRN